MRSPFPDIIAFWMAPVRISSRSGLLVAQQLASRVHIGRKQGGRCVEVQQMRCLAGVTNLPLLDSGQEQLLRKYIDMLLEQNKVMNLTAVQTAEDAWERHVQDSLALLPVIDRNLPGSRKWIDVGSGAGLPGLVLAVARPQWQWTLLDAAQKRCAFVEQVAEELGIKNVRVVWARAEAAGRDPSLREGFDGALARAVAELRALSELSLPFVRVGGCFIAAKGPNPEEEVRGAEAAMAALGGELQGMERVESFGPEGQRTAVVVRKTAATPEKFPRREGRPQKRPL